MLPIGFWLHSALGFIFGILTVSFAIIAKRTLDRKIALLNVISLPVVFTFVSVLLISAYLSVLYGGALNEWENLGKPGEENKAVKVLDIRYIQAETGEIFTHRGTGCCDSFWVKVESVPEIIGEGKLSSDENCGTLWFLPIMKDGFVDHQAACVYWSVGFAKEVYAIDEIGRVWVWWNGTGDFAVMESLFLLLVGGGISLGLSSIIVAVIVIHNLIKRKNN